MTYSTLNSRAIVIPELDTTIHIDTIELPADLTEQVTMIESGEFEYDQELLEESLASHCQEIFGLSWVDVLTASRWKAYTAKMSATMTSPTFKDQMSQVYGGGNVEEKQKIENWIETNADRLMYLERSFGDVTNFVSGLNRGLLSPYRSARHENELPIFSDYQMDRTIIQSIYGDLRAIDANELELAHWRDVSKILTRPISPSAKVAFDNLAQYEIPIAGSPKLKPMNLGEILEPRTQKAGVRPAEFATVRRVLYGAAYLISTNTAISAAATISKGELPSIVFVLGGLGTALVFVGVGEIGLSAIRSSRIRIEKYLAGQSRKTRKAPKHKQTN
ncbi:MAG TPA: hypothetical protein VJ875_13090 [Pyrinomonadaceae bacterium]|nr:hypothetical protein [Pyrinomonadaceae bacterium]